MSEVPNCSFLEKPNDEGICKIDLKNPFLIIILVTVAVIGVIVLSAVVSRLVRKPIPRSVVYAEPDTRFVTRSDTSGIINLVSAVPMPGEAVRARRAAPPGTSSQRINQVGMPYADYTPDVSSREGTVALSINHTAPLSPPLSLQYPSTPFLSRGTTGMTLANLVGNSDNALANGYSPVLASSEPPPTVPTTAAAADPRSQLFASIRAIRQSD